MDLACGALSPACGAGSSVPDLERGTWHRGSVERRQQVPGSEGARVRACAPGWGSRRVPAPSSPRGSRSAGWRLLQPTASGSFSWLDPAPALRSRGFWWIPSAGRAVYTSVVVVTQPHPSKSAEPTTVTSPARALPVWAGGGDRRLSRRARSAQDRAAFVWGLTRMRWNLCEAPVSAPCTHPAGGERPPCSCGRGTESRDWRPEGSCARG